MAAGITLLSWGIVLSGCGYAHFQASSALETTWQCMTKPPRWLCLEVLGFHRGRPERCCGTQHPCSERFTLDGAKLDICIPECAEIFHGMWVTRHFGESQSRGLSTSSLAFMFLVKGLKCSSSQILNWECFSLCCNKQHNGWFLFQLLYEILSTLKVEVYVWFQWSQAVIFIS